MIIQELTLCVVRRDLLLAKTFDTPSFVHFRLKPSVYVPEKVLVSFVDPVSIVRGRLVPLPRMLLDAASSEYNSSSHISS